MNELLAEIFRTYHMDIYTYLYSLSRDASLSEDLTSEVFLDVVRSISSFRGQSDIKTWLFTIARRKWIDYLRKKDRELKTESIHELYDSVRSPVSDPMEEDPMTMIHEILASESHLTKEIVAMRIDGYSYFEIAAKTGISENSARVIYFRAKAKIKKHFEKEGLTP